MYIGKDKENKQRYDTTNEAKIIKNDTFTGSKR